MSTAYYLQVGVSLLVLTLLLILVLKLSKIVRKKKFSGELKITDRLVIDNGVSLIIAKVREEEYLLSIGGKEVKVLQQL